MLQRTLTLQAFQVQGSGAFAGKRGTRFVGRQPRRGVIHRTRRQKAVEIVHRSSLRNRYRHAEMTHAAMSSTKFLIGRYGVKGV